MIAEVMEPTVVQDYFQKLIDSWQKEPESFDLENWYLSWGKGHELHPLQKVEKRIILQPPPIEWQNTEKKVLGSLDFLDFLNPLNWVGCAVPITQHYGSTLESLRSTPFSDSARLSIARASRFPDFNDFTNLPAHAQSVSKNGVVENPVEDQKKFIAWLQSHLVELKKCAEEDDAAGVLFEIGYILHAIQDFGVHQGQSNAEHSYNNRVGRSPDQDKEKADLAAKMSYTFLHDYILGKMKLFSPRFAALLYNWETEEKWLSRLRLKVDLIGSICTFLYQEHRYYEGRLDEAMDLQKLDARWPPFDSRKLPDLKDICHYYFDPITEMFS